MPHPNMKVYCVILSVVVILTLVESRNDNCPYGCESCDDQMNCFVCKSGYYLHIKQTSLQIECEICPSNCESCINFKGCTKCYSDYYIMTEYSTNVCKYCDPTICSACADNVGCIKPECPQLDFYYENSCVSCVMCNCINNCEHNQGCTKCDDNYILEKHRLGYMTCKYKSSGDTTIIITVAIIVVICFLISIFVYIIKAMNRRTNIPPPSEQVTLGPARIPDRSIAPPCERLLE